MNGASPPNDPPAAAVPRLPLLPGFFRLIPMGTDSIQVRSAGRVVRLSGQGIAELATPVLSALDGRTTIAELSARFSVERPLLERLVAGLFREGVVCDGDEWHEIDPVTVNAAAMEFYGELGGRPNATQAAIARSRVAVIGLGPVARLVSQHLAVAGVGELVIFDSRPVSAVDQAILPAEGEAVGRSRAELTSEECTRWGAAAALSPRVTVVDPEPEPAVAMATAVEGVDLAIVEIDESGVQAEVANKTCLAAGITQLLHEETPLRAVIGPAVQPFHSACYECVIQRRLGHLRHYDEHVAWQASLRDGTVPSRQAALVPGCAAIAAGLVSVEALRLLGGYQAASTVNGLLIADFSTLQVSREDVLAVPWCSACGSREPTVLLDL